MKTFHPIDFQETPVRQEGSEEDRVREDDRQEAADRSPLAANEEKRMKPGRVLEEDRSGKRESNRDRASAPLVPALEFERQKEKENGDVVELAVIARHQDRDGIGEEK
jgi:hypothetical protein